MADYIDWNKTESKGFPSEFLLQIKNLYNELKGKYLNQSDSDLASTYSHVGLYSFKYSESKWFLSISKTK